MFSRRIIIYESSSKGGNFNYAIELFHAYRKDFDRVTLLLPRNSLTTRDNRRIHKILLSDGNARFRWYSKFLFLYRSVLNPLILFLYTLREPPSLIFFNDFEQFTAPMWSLLFRVFQARHQYAVFLHDPDRDQYPPSLRYSNYSMMCMMKLMHIGLYHEFLPNKSYYKNHNTTYVAVPHGIYHLQSADQGLKCELIQFKQMDHLFCILGNIRREKNYDLAIGALRYMTQTKLIIAGSPSNSQVDIKEYKKLVKAYDLEDRVLWHIRYLTEPEMASIIEVSDCVVLNYAKTFASQSGILSQIAPFRKKLIVSDTESSLTSVVRRFNLGVIIKADSEDALIDGMTSIRKKSSKDSDNWDDFIAYSAWSKQVNIVSKLYVGE